MNERRLRFTGSGGSIRRILSSRPGAPMLGLD
jgi:hypothetical protein